MNQGLRPAATRRLWEVMGLIDSMNDAVRKHL